MADDSLRFMLSAEEVVVNTTVKVIAMISATISRETPEQTLKDSLRDMMKRFIDTEWQFSGMARASSTSGMEDVRVTATARVPESENYGLDRRREEASREGMRIYSHQTDTSPTIEQRLEAQSKLRQTLLSMAMDEAATLGNLLSVQYRLGKVVFTDPGAAIEPKGGARMAMAAASASYGSGFNEAGDIGNAVKLAMTASVILRRCT